MSTIKAVADLVSVSVGTVSHVVTGSVPVSDPLRNKVLAAIQGTGLPSELRCAQSENQPHSNAWDHCSGSDGFLLPPGDSRRGDGGARSWIHPDRGEFRRRRGAAEGTALDSALPTSRRNSARRGGSPLRSRRLRGWCRRAFRWFAWTGYRIGWWRIRSRWRTRPRQKMASEHLLEMGYRRIALATGPLALKNERRRLLGGTGKRWSRAGIDFDKRLVWAGTLRPEDVADLCREKLQATEPDAVFATNAPTGLGVLRAFRQLGIRTPEDLGFVTFDELTVDDLFSPAVTAIVQPAFEIGFRAAEILLERIRHRGESIEPESVRLPASLKVRETSRLRGAARIALLPAVDRMTV